MTLAEISGVYAIFCEPTASIYVGSSYAMPFRYKGHFQKLRRGVSEIPRLQNLFDEYGEDSLSFHVLEYVSPDISFGHFTTECFGLREKWWIEKIAENCPHLNLLNRTSCYSHQKFTLDKSIHRVSICLWPPKKIGGPPERRTRNMVLEELWARK